MKRAILALPALLLLSGANVPDSGSVTVTIEGLRSNRGLVQACLTADPATFPDCARDPHAHRLTVSAHEGETIAFQGVAPGRYAIALLHDENSNGRVDKVLMMPKEGFGFSRDAAVRFGPPRFSAAAFEIGAAAMKTTIRMRYLL
jgi:uncharacterized protein (DUF2141 family)